MVFRKPYALLIKHFKFIHLIISIFMSYLIYKTNNIYKFFNSYVKAGWMSLNEAELAGYIGPLIYFSITLIIFLAIIVYVLMRFKNKPRLYYLLTPITYFMVLILFIVTNSTMSVAINDVVNPVNTRVLRDLMLIAMGVQFVFVIFSVLRAIGFDVKKFNFKQDIADLQIEELDNEEVEVNIEVDKYKLGRKVKRRVRNYKYIYQENKFIVYLITGLVLGGFVLSFILNTFVLNPTHKEGKTIELNGYNLIVNKSYITNKDYLGNEISKSNKYILVDLSVINRITDNTFDIDKLSLLINGTSYSPSTNIYTDFIDLGNGYKEQKLSTNNINRYYVVFKIPNDVNTRKVILRYLNKVEYDKNNNEVYKYKKIRLNLINDESITTIDKNLGDETNINGNSVKINEYSINDSFNYSYKLCSSKNNCSDNSNYVVSKSNSTTILRLVVDGKLSNSVNSSIKNMSHYFSTFGSLTYVKDGKTYRQKKLNNLVSNTFNGKEILLEVTNEVKNAESINLELRIRNTNYKFKLK